MTPAVRRRTLAEPLGAATARALRPRVATATADLVTTGGHP